MDVGTNFRHLYPMDLARVSAMGVKAYSFSISWSRVMPLGE
jgi:beta-glucosidase/6-phospho-beta-glucosidase/beta-galactosidase